MQVSAGGYHILGLIDTKGPITTAPAAVTAKRGTKGKFKLYVYATDLAGNVQSNLGSNTLTVK